MKAFVAFLPLLALAVADQHSHQIFKQGNAPAVHTSIHKPSADSHAIVHSQPAATPDEVHQYANEEKIAASNPAPSHFPVHAPAHGFNGHPHNNLHDNFHARAHGNFNGHAFNNFNGNFHDNFHHNNFHHDNFNRNNFHRNNFHHDNFHARPHGHFNAHHQNNFHAAHPVHQAVSVAPIFKAAPVHHAVHPVQQAVSVAPIFKAAPVHHAVHPVHPAPVAHPAPVYHAPAHHANSYHEPAYETPALYQYGYAVADDYSGANFEQHENRDGYATSGEYRVNLPDGRTQIVTYSVGDEYSGYVADVRYEGEAHYDSYEPNHPVAHPAPHPVAHPNFHHGA